jgi:hypothetical protein
MAGNSAFMTFWARPRRNMFADAPMLAIAQHSQTVVRNR